MTDMKDKLKEIRERLEAATPGPWFPCGCRYTMISREHSAQETEDIAEVCNHFRSDDEIQSNVNLIANAPTDIARLLKVVEVLGEALEELIDNCKYDPSPIPNTVNAVQAQQKAREIMGGEG